MKKKILAAILTATLLIAGCSDMANVSAGQDNTMVLVEGWRDYGIYADKDTGVMYLVYQRNGTGCTVIWQGEEKKVLKGECAWMKKRYTRSA